MVEWAFPVQAASDNSHWRLWAHLSCGVETLKAAAISVIVVPVGIEWIRNLDHHLFWWMIVSLISSKSRPSPIPVWYFWITSYMD